MIDRLSAGHPDRSGRPYGNDAVKRIVIADDHEVVRSGLRAIVDTRSDWIVAGEATNGEQAVALVVETRPDIVIVDYSMPLMNGLEGRSPSQVAACAYGGADPDDARK